jgi:5-formyltetrahydrofolate cyclo-ligase
VRAERRREQKVELRERIRLLREGLSPEDRSRRSGAVAEALFGLPEVRGAGVVALFSSFGSEIDTAPIIERAHAEGRRVLLPYLDEGVMEVAEHRPGDDLVPSSYGPAEPSRREAVDPGEVDAAVVPGLAFDRRGRRLGYGAGFYDRWLRRLRPNASRIGIGFSFQVVDRVPADGSDERVDVVITDEGVIRVRGDEGGSPL